MRAHSPVMSDKDLGSRFRHVQLKSTIGVDSDISRRVSIICSTEAIDAHSDIVRQSGWRLGRFLKNPIILYQHAHQKPIARAIDISVSGGKLRALVEFPKFGTNQLADEVWALIRAGVLKGISVGFLIRDADLRQGEPRGFVINEAELLEVSFVSVPANPECLITTPASALAKETSEEARARRIAAAKHKISLIDGTVIDGAAEKARQRRVRIARAKVRVAVAGLEN